MWGMKVSYNGGVDWNNINPEKQRSWVTPCKSSLDNVLVEGIMLYIKVTLWLSWDSISPTYGS